MGSVGEEMPRLMASVREILGEYKKLGPVGAFGAMMIERDLREADEAVMSGDVVRILASYEALKGIS